MYAIRKNKNEYGNFIIEEVNEKEQFVKALSPEFDSLEDLNDHLNRIYFTTNMGKIATILEFSAKAEEITERAVKDGESDIDVIRKELDFAMYAVKTDKPDVLWVIVMLSHHENTIDLCELYLKSIDYQGGIN
jgi:hypothetical protein